MESDSEDDTYDWSSLGARVLKRGEKDHAPDGTVVQQSYIQRSREAMYTALAYTAHTSEKHLLEADWLEDRQLGSIRKQKGNMLMTMGWSESTQLLVHPEELVYLCQRGSLVCYLNNEKLDLAGVMALCLKTGLTAEKMAVYSNLKKLGFIVRRPDQVNEVSEPVIPHINKQSLYSAVVWRLFGTWFSKLAWQRIYTSFLSIYCDLQAVELRKNQAARAEFDFHAYKPGTKFKKTSPPKPDFCVRVLEAKKLPTLALIESDFASTSAIEYKNMKLGFRNFIAAVVDNGIVSYVRMTETAAQSP